MKKDYVRTMKKRERLVEKIRKKFDPKLASLQRRMQQYQQGMKAIQKKR